jgi:Flp pilus assembly protein TadG
MRKNSMLDVFLTDVKSRVGQVKLVGKGAKEELGQALVESAIVFVILLLILMGLVDFGRAYFTFLALQNAAAEGATFGMFHPTWQTHTSSVPDSHNPENIEYRVQHESDNGMVDWSTISVTVESLFPTPGNQITVTVAYDFELITPVGRAIARNEEITLRASAIQTIIRDDFTPP